MPRPSIHALAVATSLALLGCPGSPPGAPAPRPSPSPPSRTTSTPQRSGPTGAELFARNCTACHGADARGVANLGKDLVTSAFVAGQTDEQLVQFIKVGRAADDPANTTRVPMPPKGGNPALTDANLLSIVAHLRTLHAPASN